MNDMLGLGLMGLLGGGMGGLGGLGMGQMGIGGALAGGVPQMGMLGALGGTPLGLQGMGMGAAGQLGTPAFGLLEMFFKRKQEEEMMKQRKEMFDKWLEMQNTIRQPLLQRPVAPQMQYPLFTF